MIGTCRNRDCPHKAMSGPRPDLQKCGKCGSAFYCSSACQAFDWPHHKKMCKKVTAAGKKVTHPPVPVTSPAAAARAPPPVVAVLPRSPGIGTSLEDFDVLASSLVHAAAAPLALMHAVWQSCLASMEASMAAGSPFGAARRGRCPRHAAPALARLPLPPLRAGHAADDQVRGAARPAPRLAG